MTWGHMLLRPQGVHFPLRDKSITDLGHILWVAKVSS
jgi:hypothetical protein